VQERHFSRNHHLAFMQRVFSAAYPPRCRTSVGGAWNAGAYGITAREVLDDRSTMGLLSCLPIAERRPHALGRQRYLVVNAIALAWEAQGRRLRRVQGALYASEGQLDHSG
jgi:hypothetical protein